MEMEKVSSGSDVIDELLHGGYEKGIVTTIYGPAGSGKTNLCILLAIRTAGCGKKIVYIDTESRFPIERLKQLTRYYNRVLQNIIFFKPTSFKEQHQAFEKLRKIVNRKVGLIIVDTIATLYRLERGQTEDASDINLMLGRQLSSLIALARKYKIPVITTNQVYADFNKKDGVKMVGGSILKNRSKCLIELQVRSGKKRRAVLTKHPSLPERCLDFEISNYGVRRPTSQ